MRTLLPGRIMSGPKEKRWVRWGDGDDSSLSTVAYPTHRTDRSALGSIFLIVLRLLENIHSLEAQRDVVREEVQENLLVQSDLQIACVD